jgi:hypothetical protein
MARIRTFKPEFLRHEKLQELESVYCGNYPMFVFMGLWSVSDKNGVFEWKPKQLKLDIYPFLEFDMEMTLNILFENGFIKKYEYENKIYGYVVNFKKHQNITGTEKLNDARYPEPIKGINEDRQVQTEKEREREKEKERKAANAGGSAEPPLSDSQKSSMELADLLLTSHRKEFPDYLSGKDAKKITENWARDVEKLMRIDKKPPETIRQVILWVKTPGNFWFHNIERGKKLREKFERLFGQMTGIEKKTSPPEKERNCYVPTAEESDRLIEEMNRARKQAIVGNLSEELKKIARGKSTG